MDRQHDAQWPAGPFAEKCIPENLKIKKSFEPRADLNKRKKKHCTKVGETFLMIHPPASSINMENGRRWKINK
jgi:hypothetical protein